MSASALEQRLDRLGPWLVLAAGAGLGLAGWLLAGPLVGADAPWSADREARRYLGLLFAAGLALSLVDPEPVWPGPVGLYLGQAVALVVRAALGLAPAKPDYHVTLQLLLLVPFTMPALVGAALPRLVELWWQAQREAGSRDG